MDWYNSAAIDYEGVRFLFPTVLRHRQLLQLRNWKPASLHRLGDGMQAIRLLASVDPHKPTYVSADNAREAYVPTGVNRCTSLSDYGWCVDPTQLNNTAFDTAEVYMGQGFAIMNNGTEIWQYYNGEPEAHGEGAYMGLAETQARWGNNTGIGLLRQRLDGFVSVGAEQSQSSEWLPMDLQDAAVVARLPGFVTVPLQVPPKPAGARNLSLLLNVETGAAGGVAVELRAKGVAIPAHAIGIAEVVFGSWVARPARWNAGASATCHLDMPPTCLTSSLDASLAGAAVEVAVYMQDAKMFSIAFEWGV